MTKATNAIVQTMRGPVGRSVTSDPINPIRYPAKPTMYAVDSPPLRLVAKAGIIKLANTRYTPTN